MKKIIYTALMILGISPILKADPATPVAAPNGSIIETNLNIQVENDKDTVHLISTNNDPNIFTKTFILKHADPYEIRPYLRTAASSERITGGEDFVSCLKYKDGTGIIIVSAEEYKFSKEAMKAQGVAEEDCMCIEDIVKKLDLPGLTSSSGQKKFMYFPKYRSAQEIATMAQNSGLNVRNDPSELLRGQDDFSVDVGLNAVLFYAPPYNLPAIYERLAIYDQALPEAKVAVKVYELDYENDGKVGADFQAWKNGPGTDLFSIASRFGNGMNPAGLVDGTGWSKAKVIQLSPRWNTRFLDFLAAKSKAHIVVEGQLNIRNNTQGYLNNMTGVPNFTDGNPVANNAYFDYEDIMGNWVPWGATATNVANGFEHFTFRMFDTRGTQINLSNAMNARTIRATRVNNTNDNRTIYTLQIINGGGAFFVKNGKNMGTKINGYNLEIMNDANADDVAVAAQIDWDAYPNNWANDHQLTAQKNFQRDTQISTYGFQMTIEPTICQNSTSLALNMQNTSLIGFTENANGAAGAARTMTSEVNTTLMANNQNQRFIIGGLEKTAVVSSISKVPWLGSIPLLGWIFTSESEVSKKSRLVAVVECEHQAPEQVIPRELSKVIKVIDEDTVDAGKTNWYGYDQWLIDKNKKSLNKLP